MVVKILKAKKVLPSIMKSATHSSGGCEMPSKANRLLFMMMFTREWRPADDVA